MIKIKKPDGLALKRKTSSFFASFFCYALLILVSFIILFPFISKISSSFMSVEDMYDRTVTFIPRKPTLDNYAFVIKALDYFNVALRTVGLSLLCALLQTFVAAITGYALAKLKKFGNIAMALVIATILVPPQVIMLPMYLKFRFFDIFGIFELITGSALNTLDTAGGTIPFIILSVTGLAFKNGIYIFLLRQFYKGIPEELEEAAYIDGCGTYKTFFRIVLRISGPMLVTVFLLSFCWQWTDTFYTNLFLKSDSVLSTAIFALNGVQQEGTGAYYSTVITNTAVIIALVPLIILYVFGQRKLVAGIERSGLTGF